MVRSRLFVKLLVAAIVPAAAATVAAGALHLSIEASLFLVVLAALLVAYPYSRRLHNRVVRLRLLAEQMADARAPAAPSGLGDDELGSLGRALEQTGREVRRLIERSSLESAGLEAILGSMVEGVVAVDSQLRVTFSNHAFARLVASGASMPERPALLEVVRDSNLQDAVKHALETGEAGRQRMQLPVSQGRVFEVQTTPLLGPKGRGALAILHDVTELERLERVRKDFVANVSHELRTPLTAIQGCAETLLEGALEDPETNRRFLRIIRDHAIRLDNITSDLLILSELESGKSMYSAERVRVRTALEAALESVEAEARERGVRVVRGEIDHCEVKGHGVRLEQALANLLSNAVKFNRPGGEVRVDVEQTADGKTMIRVADTGIGIPSEDLARIFERFYRVDKARSREVGGTGLGLSIVKHIIERMNGTVSVESQLGKGSTFTVVLPTA